jgi:hypothetical protein
MTDHSNFLLILIITSLAMFILLCPRKTDKKTEKFIYENNNNQESQYLLPDIEFETNRNNMEYSKANYIKQMNMQYDTRGDINDLINLNQLPHEGTMFVYP